MKIVSSAAAMLARIMGTAILMASPATGLAVPVTSGLHVQLDASNVDGNNNASLSNGSSISSWTNLSATPNGVFAVTQDTGACQPVLATNGLNGRPAVHFDNNDDFLQSTTFTAPLAQPTQIFVVWKADSWGTYQSALALDGLSGARNTIAYESVGGTPCLTLFAGASMFTSNSFPFAAPIVETVTYGASPTSLRTDGMARRMLGSTPGSQSLSGITVGGRYDVYNGHRLTLDGCIAEILIYNPPLNAADTDAVESYLYHKWFSATNAVPSFGLAFWLDGEDLDGDGAAEGSGEAGLLGSQVTNWANKAPIDGTPTGVSQTNLAYAPALASNGLKGRPVVRFDGQDDFLKSAGFPMLLSQPTEMFLVFKAHPTCIVVDGMDGSARQGISFEMLSETPKLGAWANGVGFYDYVAIPTSQPICVTTYFSGTNSWIRTNGADALTSGMDTGLGGLGGVTVGGRYEPYNDSRMSVDGDIAELLIYDVPLTTADRDKVEAYLYNKWLAPPRGTVMLFR